MRGMSPVDTITFLCGLLMCIIGIATFISGLLTRARKDGQLEYKVDSLLKSIDEIKSSLEHHNGWKQELAVKVEGHQQNIESLFRKHKEVRSDIDALRKEINDILMKGEE